VKYFIAIIALLACVSCHAQSIDTVHADVYGYVASLETSYGDDTVVMMILCNDDDETSSECIELVPADGIDWPTGLTKTWKGRGSWRASTSP
jgi:hypothetical protein